MHNRSCQLGIRFRLINDYVATNSRPYTSEYYGGKGPPPVDPFEWTDIRKRNQLLWQLLLVGWFFPAKILIQRFVKNKFGQIIMLLGLFCLAAFWILSRLVIWHDWPGVTLKHHTIGTPVEYLFVPFAFVVYDLFSNKKTVWDLVRRIPLEMLLIIPWAFV